MKKAAFIVLAIVLMLFISVTSYADDAKVLPKGVSSIGVQSNIYFSIEDQYNQDGKVERADAHYNTVLDSSVFPDLSAVEVAFGMTAGTGNVGQSDVSFKYDFTIFHIAFNRGITDKLTMGIRIPYWKAKNTVSAEVNSANATVGKSAVGAGGAAPLVSLAVDPFGDAAPLTTDDVQKILGNGLDINNDGTIDVAGFGYEPIKSWSYNGIGDIEAGFRYQYLDTENWRLAFTGGLRFPTGQTDDPDNLIDYGVGDGAYAVLFRLNNDYKGLENITLNTTFRYDLLLPAKIELRAPADPDLPITTSDNKEKIKRDIGDVFEFEASGNYNFSSGFNFSLLYKFGYKPKDSISKGSKGLDYTPIENASDYKEHIYKIGLSYSTIPLYMKKKFPVPLSASVSYRNRFDGENKFKSDYIGLGLEMLL